ncbi:hypothetical protein EV05_1181 [Prochlorococcus sp. MIT 0601]|nr:hypothetical protein EV05_1181 [Prochlorococcus sp. MIT 0601]
MLITLKRFELVLVCKEFAIAIADLMETLCSLEAPPKIIPTFIRGLDI